MANRIKDSNITPGTITNDKLAPGTISNASIAPGTIANDKLVNNSITINGTSINLGASGNIVAGTDWQAVVTADGSTATTASAGEGYFIDTTSATHTINLPSSPSQGDEVHIVDYAGTFGSNNVTVGRNGSNIDGVAFDATLSTNRLNVRFVYIDSTQGWRAIFDDASESYGATFITATGGTVTESGDYKIHTFTGDGCFVVSDAGNAAGSNTVDYLVIAGGGGGGANNEPIYSDGTGGGGAGGARMSSGTASGCYTASPLGACVSALPVSVTTYPVTVGGGGAGGVGDTCKSTSQANPGSNSVFSTITSTGGGGGGTHQYTEPTYPTRNGLPGGSGGGAGGGWTCASGGGSGNTPPVSPPQGNDGGHATSSPDGSGGGGGGAGAAGDAGNPAIRTGDGGKGITNAISGSSVNYAGGGGSAVGINNPRPAGYGGVYPGGCISAPQVDRYGAGNGGRSTCGTAATANTGGGGGAANGQPGFNDGGAGGKGIVIIRYKFQ